MPRQPANKHKRRDRTSRGPRPQRSARGDDRAPPRPLEDGQVRPNQGDPKRVTEDRLSRQTSRRFSDSARARTSPAAVCIRARLRLPVRTWAGDEDGASFTSPAACDARLPVEVHRSVEGEAPDSRRGTRSAQRRVPLLRRSAAGAGSLGEPTVWGRLRAAPRPSARRLLERLSLDAEQRPRPCPRRGRSPSGP